MRHFKSYRIVLFLAMVLAMDSCIDPFEFQTETFEDALIIEASLTNEFKRHQVKLSRAVRFEDSISAPERNAQVRILDEMQNEYAFEEIEPGNYSAIVSFAAQIGVKYNLVVVTSDGTSYSSEPESFESESQIEDVYANRETNDEGDEGIAIFTDSYDASGMSHYYRYEYEETYKIIAPHWTPVDFELTNYEPCNPDFSSTAILYDLDIVRRDQEEQTCYNTVNSTDIVQSSSAGFAESRIERFPLRFIPASDFILTYRYIILVTQYVQSVNAFSYYQSLDAFSSSGSVFTNIQPGFLEANIAVDNNADKKVLGYFEVASVSKKRIFFGFRDFYPDAPLPLYINKCVLFSTHLEHISYCFNGPLHGSSCPESLIEKMAKNAITFISENDGSVGLTCPGE